MARILLTPPTTSVFCTELVIQIGDINYGNHLSNDAVLRMTHEARLRWLKSGGFSELDCAGCGLIMADVAVMYKNQGFHGDVLTFFLAVGEVGRAGFELYTTITRKADNQVIAIVKNGMVFFDYEKQKVGQVPKQFCDFIQ